MVRIAITLFLLLIGANAAFAGPLHDAARAGNQEQVLALIDSGTDPNELGPNGETPLNLAILGDHVLVASLLIDRGADVQAGNRGGFTPLHAAAFVNQVEIAAKLLAQGADVNDQKNKAGVSPLSVASEEGSAEVAKVLIDHGADLEATEQNGYTALTRAIWRGQAEVISLLQKSGAKCQPVEVLEEPAYSDCMAGQL